MTNSGARSLHAFDIRRALAAAGIACALALAPAVPAFADDASAEGEGDAAAATYVTPFADPTPASLSEEELDTAIVGTYTYQGVAHDITARQVIEDTRSVASVSNGDGTYAAPTADMVLDYVRNQILMGLVAEAGIEVSDEDVSAYALQAVGTDDFATIAQYYQMDEEQARTIVTSACAVVKLRESVVGTSPTAPEAPVAPDADADATEATSDYAAYILNLVGDAWDAEGGTWSTTDSYYYQTLSGYGFDGQTATYEMAQQAYYIAYSLYSQEASSQSSAWLEYANTYLGQATVSIATLRS